LGDLLKLAFLANRCELSFEPQKNERLGGFARDRF